MFATIAAAITVAVSTRVPRSALASSALRLRLPPSDRATMGRDTTVLVTRIHAPTMGPDTDTTATLILIRATTIRPTKDAVAARRLLRRLDAEIAQDAEHHLTVTLEDAHGRFEIGWRCQQKVVQHL